jgi:hypothetical protein
MKRVGSILRDLAAAPNQTLTDDALEAILEGLSLGPECRSDAQADAPGQHEEPGLPLGWSIEWVVL